MSTEKMKDLVKNDLKKHPYSWFLIIFGLIGMYVCLIVPVDPETPMYMPYFALVSCQVVILFGYVYRLSDNLEELKEEIEVLKGRLDYLEDELSEFDPETYIFGDNCEAAIKDPANCEKSKNDN